MLTVIENSFWDNDDNARSYILNIFIATSSNFLFPFEEDSMSPRTGRKHTDPKSWIDNNYSDNNIIINNNNIDYNCDSGGGNNNNNNLLLLFTN